jgi:hypothetical protein
MPVSIVSAANRIEINKQPTPIGYDPNVLLGGLVAPVTTSFQAVGFGTVLLGQVVYKRGDGLIEVADCLLDNARQIAGIVTVGGPLLTVVTDGLITNPAWAFPIGQQVFLGSNGAILNVPLSNCKYSVLLGHAPSATELLVRISPPIRTLN